MDTNRYEDEEQTADENGFTQIWFSKIAEEDLEMSICVDLRLNLFSLTSRPFVSIRG
jgi:hypothetical protein